MSKAKSLEELLPKLHTSRYTLKIYSLIYLLTLHYDEPAWINLILHDLGFNKNTMNADERQRFYMIFRRTVERLRKDFFMSIEIKTASKTQDKKWGTRYIEICDYGVFSKSAILDILRCYQDFFAQNYKRLLCNIDE